MRQAVERLASTPVARRQRLSSGLVTLPLDEQKRLRDQDSSGRPLTEKRVSANETLRDRAEHEGW